MQKRSFIKNDKALKSLRIKKLSLVSVVIALVLIN